MNIDATVRHPLTGAPWVRCARCDTPVDEMIRHADPMRIVITVRCHGEEETSALSFRAVADANAIALGDAFTANPPTHWLPIPPPPKE